MKSIIQSIRPQYLCDILNGIKKIEVRKSYIKPPFTSHTYCTKAKHKNDYLVFNEQLGKYELTKKSDKALNGKVVAEYVCDEVEQFTTDYRMKDKHKLLNKILSKGKVLYAYHITDLKIYDKPKELREFSFYKKEKYGSESVGYVTDKTLTKVERPPQDFMYVEELK